MTDQHVPPLSVPNSKSELHLATDTQKHMMQQVMDEAEQSLFYSAVNNGKSITTRDVNTGSPLYQKSSKDHSTRRRFQPVSSTSTNTFGMKRSVTLEIPFQYRSQQLLGVVSEPPTQQQTSRFAVQTSFPIYTPQRRSKPYNKSLLSGNTTTLYAKSTSQYLIPDISCHLSASTAIRDRYGSTTGTVNIQYRWDHINEKRKKHDDTPSTMKQQTIQRWSTTAHTGLGVSDAEMESPNGPQVTAYGNISNLIPLQSLKFGVCTNVTHHQSSSSSLSINVESRALSRSRIEVPIIISNDQQICIPSIKKSKQSTINVRSKCVTSFGYRSFQWNSPTINASLTLSPTTFSKSTKTSQQSIQKPPASFFNKIKESILVLQNWTVQLGINKMRDSLYPFIGCSLSMAIPNLLKSLWTWNPTSAAKNKLLDISFQWNGNQGWQVGGRWTLKKSNRSIQGGPPPPPTPTRQVGIGVSMNKKFKNGRTSTKNPITTMIFSWTEGDFTLRVPILIASANSTRALLYDQGWQLFYLTFLSTIIQDVISHFFLLDELDDKESDVENYDVLKVRSQKLRQEAMMQQRFMEKQAKARTDLEVKKNGLVIRRAIMYVHEAAPGGNGTNGALVMDASIIDTHQSFDATIPLQFWLSPNESKLQLYGKRSCMLGFYDLAKNMSIMPSNSDDTKSPSTSTTTITLVNRLWIQYTYEGQLYEIVVNDDDIYIELPDIQHSKKVVANSVKKLNQG